MILPIKDIIFVQTSRAYRIGHHGMVCIVKGHEELFFELSSRERRDLFMNTVQHRIDAIQADISASKEETTQDKEEALILQDLEASTDSSGPRPLPETTEDVPPIMFRSTSSEFVTFKPQKSLHFTCLTIGSRGDVQPYIALCKGLIEEGHRCRIATHGEYKDWVEGHGIEFASIGGDPAELMRSKAIQSLLGGALLPSDVC